MLAIENIGLGLPTPELTALVERHLPQERITPFLHRAWPGPGSVFLAVPPGYRQIPPPKLGTFRWPSGASRWASGLFVCGNDLGQVDAIREKAFGTDGTKAQKVRLKITSPDANTGEVLEPLETDVYVLAVVPLWRVVPESSGGGSEDGSIKGTFLIHVVDARYYWWSNPTPDFEISESGTVTWANVFEKIGNTLGITVDTSEINAKYLRPSRALNLTYENLPPVFDAAAANVGCRVIRKYNGNVSVQNFQDALDAYNADAESFPDRQFLSGDFRFLEKL